MMYSVQLYKMEVIIGQHVCQTVNLLFLFSCPDILISYIYHSL